MQEIVYSTPIILDVADLSVQVPLQNLKRHLNAAWPVVAIIQ